MAKRRTVFLSGASGFIGRHLRSFLESDYNILCPSSRELDLTSSSAVDQYFKLHDIDVVLHTATWNATITSHRDRSQVFKSNLQMAVNLFRQVSNLDKLIHFGSGAEYTRAHYKPLMKESYLGRYIPTMDYGFSKYIIHHLGSRSSKIYNLRLFGVFGPYEDWRIRFIGNAMAKVLFDLPITIRQDTMFDYLYVQRVCEVTRAFIERDDWLHRSYNICSGKPMLLSDIADKIRKLAGLREYPIIVRDSGLGVEYSGCNQRLLAEYSLEESNWDNELRSYFEFVRNNRSEIDPNVLLDPHLERGTLGDSCGQSVKEARLGTF